jgi:hypothetical protein
MPRVSNGRTKRYIKATSPDAPQRDPVSGIVTLDIGEPAVFSPCRRWRYLLRREVNILGSWPLVMIGFNPSLAAEEQNDPTIRREIAFASEWGASRLIKVNVFAAISPYPDDMADLADPVGPQNDEAIRLAAAYADARGGKIVACWGVPKGRAVTKRLAEARFAQIRGMGFPLHVLRLTQGGFPEHPLYLPKTLEPIPWE